MTNVQIFDHDQRNLVIASIIYPLGLEPAHINRRNIDDRYVVSISSLEVSVDCRIQNYFDSIVAGLLFVAS